MSKISNNTNLVEFSEELDDHNVYCCVYCGEEFVVGGPIPKTEVRELLAMGTAPCPSGVFAISDISLLLLTERVVSSPHKQIEEEDAGNDLRSLKALLVSGFSTLENVLGGNVPLQIRSLIQSIQCENAVFERMALNEVPF
jgi:hypothetical protein